jgi:hypothetical protein
MKRSSQVIAFGIPALVVCLLLVGEAYLRVALNGMFAATADFQYLADDINDDDNPDGWVGSVRLTAEF